MGKYTRQKAQKREEAAQDAASHFSATVTLGEETFTLIGITGEESISGAFAFKLEFIVAANMNMRYLLGKQGVFQLNGIDGSTRQIAGVVRRVDFGDLIDGTSQRVVVHWRPVLSAMELSNRARLLTHKSVQEVVKLLLTNIGYLPQQILWSVLQKCDPIKSVRQLHTETEFEFFQRLLASRGIAFLCETDEHGFERMVFADDNSAYTASNLELPWYNLNAINLTTDVGVFTVEIDTKLVTEVYKVSDYFEFLQEPWVESEYGSGYGKHNIYGGSGGDPNQVPLLAKYHAERAQVERQHFSWDSNAVRARAGQHITLTGPRGLDINYYLIAGVKHKFRAPLPSQGDKNAKTIPYQNTFTCILSKTKFRPAILPPPAGPRFFLGNIVEYPGGNNLSESGHYAVRPKFQMSSEKDVWTDLPHSQLYSSESPPTELAVGFHMPLPVGTEVLLSCINGDIDRPMVLGALPNSAQPSPVTSENADEYIFRTLGGHELIIKENDALQKIQLSTPRQENRLTMTTDRGESNMELVSEYGQINFQAKKNLNITSGGDLIETSAQSISHQIKNDHRVTAQQDIHMQSGKAMRLSAKEKLSLHSGGNIEIQSGDTITNTAQKNLTIKVHGDTALMDAPKGKISMKAGKSLRVKGNGKAPLYFYVDGEKTAGFVLHPNGLVQFFGDKVTFNAENIKFQGRVNFQSGLTIPTPPRPSAPIMPQPIPTLKPEGNPAIHSLHWDKPLALHDQQVTAKFTTDSFEGNEPGTLKVYSAPSTTPDGKPPKPNSQKLVCEKPLQLQQKSEVVSVPLTGAQDFKNGGDAGGKIIFKTSSELTATERAALPNLTHFTFAVSIDAHTNALPSEPLAVVTPLTLVLQDNLGQPLPDGTVVRLKTAITGKTVTLGKHERTIFHTGFVKEGKVTLEHVPLGTVLLSVELPQNYVATTNPNAPSPLPHPAEIFDDQKSHPGYFLAITLDSLTQTNNMPPIIVVHLPIVCNMRDNADPKKISTRCQLTAEEIAYLKHNGNNVTVFIHGFNVSAGEFGRYVDDIKIVMPPSPQGPAFSGSSNESISDASAIIANAPCTLWRDPQKMPQQFPQFDPKTQTNHDQWLSDDPRAGHGKLNGSDAHSWVVNLEHNLNKAAGFDGEHYDKFSRIVMVEWSGDQGGAEDYMAAVEHTTAAAEKLTQLLQQLIAADLTVNIIAHSLGNAVLLTALNTLGMESFSEYNDKINHVFLWDAAIPNNALSDRKLGEKSPSYRGQREYALEQLKTDRWFLPYAHRVPKKITVLYSENDNILGPIPDAQPPGVTQADMNKEKPFTELLTALLVTRLGLHGLYQLAMWVGVPVTELLNTANQENFYQQWIKGRTRNMTLNPITGRYQWTPAASGIFNTYTVPYPDTLDDLVNDDAPEQQAFYEQLRQRLEANEADINQQLQAAGYANQLPVVDVSEWLAIHAQGLLDLLNTLTGGIALAFDTTLHMAKRAWALATMVLYDTKFKEAPAMGYTGPDLNDLSIKRLYDSGKLLLVDQKPWLFSHSGMKVPTQSLMQHVYIDRILKAGDYQFGKYPPQK